MRKLSVLLIVMLMVAGLVPLANAQDEEPFALTIMHTNDTHAHHEAEGGNGGVAIQAAVVKQIRASVANSLLLDAGDRFTGTLYHQVYDGQDNVQIMNLMGYDAMTLGNHEFDNGDEVLGAFLDGINFPVVVSNIDVSASADLAGKIVPSTVLDVNGEQVGIIGLITPDTDISSSPSDNVVFDADLVAAAQAAADGLMAEGVNKIVLLTHIGYNWDMEIAPQLSGVDIIIGGHSHTPLSNMYAGALGEYPTTFESASGEPILVVTAFSENEFMGRLDVEFDAAGVITDYDGDVILLSGYITPDAELAAVVEELGGRLQELKNMTIGETSVFLVGDRTVCRVEECNLGNLIADAMIWNTGADIAIQNGGGIRADIDEGEVTMGEVLTVLPFGNLISTLELKGEYVWAALENGVSEVENGAGRFPQVGGLRYTWDGSQEPGSRIISVDVLNKETGEYEPLDLEAIYFVATNDYMRGGGDGYSMFEDFAINPYDFGAPLDGILADYIEQFGPVAPEVEGRITRVDATE
ncbi:MAG: 5'-nucleotidase C-terminal domain-containing protein [Anaerolineae bacterium]|nr:5'-nucleotidase C-terminal domain-containing protein [Anaerolineae bacterium]